MTKDDMIALISKQTGISKKQATDVMQTFMSTVTDRLKNGEKVSFSGFGSFSVSKRKARIGRNPQTGAKIDIPATQVPVFKAGKHFKEAIKK